MDADRLFRYFNLLKSGKFGFGLGLGAIINYLKAHFGFLGSVLGEGGIYPPLVSLIVSKRCNLKCPFCIFGGSDTTGSEGDLTLPALQKILSLDLVKRTLLFVVSGGEPCLNKDLPQIVRVLRKAKYLVGMITNGCLLEQGLAKDLSGQSAGGGISDVQVSVYDNTREKLSFILPQASKFFPINASFVLTKTKLIEAAKNNFADLIDIIKMCRESGCLSLKFNLCSADIISNDDSETIKKDDDLVYLQLIDECKNKIKGASFSGYKAAPKMFSKFSVFFPAPFGFSAQRKCAQPWQLTIDGDGNTVICCKFQPFLKEKLCRNVFIEGSKIVNCKKSRAIRNSFLNSALPLEKECVNCAYMNSYGASI